MELFACARTYNTLPGILTGNDTRTRLVKLVYTAYVDGEKPQFQSVRDTCSCSIMRTRMQAGFFGVFSYSRLPYEENTKKEKIDLLCVFDPDLVEKYPVSYTHLTLPTIYSV